MTFQALSSLSSIASYTPHIRLYSLHKLPPNFIQPNNRNRRIIHLIRHAQGTHNINKEYKLIENFDAQLTPLGIEQCRQLSKQMKENNINIECIISSSMTRALQTTHYSFEYMLSSLKNEEMVTSPSIDSNFVKDVNNEESNSMRSNDNDPKRSILNSSLKSNGFIPLLVSEEWRETVNYICDKRRHTKVLKTEFPHFDFSTLQSHDTAISINHGSDDDDEDDDNIWKYYQLKFGNHDEFTKHRESDDYEGLRNRAIKAWDIVLGRPEKYIAIVSHSAFFMNMFTKLNMVSYADDDIERLMQNPFENCELRSFGVDFAV